MKDKLKKYLLPNLPYLFFVYLFDKLCQAVRLAPGLDASEKLLHIGQGFQTAFSSSAPSFHALDICVGILGAVLIRLTVYVKGKNAKKYRKGIEYGSARWGTAADIAPYIDPVPDWNIPLTRTESLTMTSRPKDPKTARNKNILVIGGSGSGKTRFFVKPSIMQMHSSYVITDPKGQLLKETGKMLLHGAPKLDENGKPVRDGRGKIIYEPYRIKVLNTINFSKSMKYNPLAYVRSEKDILKLVNVIIANTKGDGEKSSEDFWVKAERLLYCALIGFIWYEAEQHMEDDDYACGEHKVIEGTLRIMTKENPKGEKKSDMDVVPVSAHCETIQSGEDAKEERFETISAVHDAILEEQKEDRRVAPLEQYHDQAVIICMSDKGKIQKLVMDLLLRAKRRNRRKYSLASKGRVDDRGGG